jgi:hypothetical protein
MSTVDYLFGGGGETHTDEVHVFDGGVEGGHVRKQKLEGGDPLAPRLARTVLDRSGKVLIYCRQEI